MHPVHCEGRECGEITSLITDVINLEGNHTKEELTDMVDYMV